MADCSDLEPFFDGELDEDKAEEFRLHLGGCVRCQNKLGGLMQEATVASSAERTKRT